MFFMPNWGKQITMKNYKWMGKLIWTIKLYHVKIPLADLIYLVVTFHFQNQSQSMH